MSTRSLAVAATVLVVVAGFVLSLQQADTPSRPAPVRPLVPSPIPAVTQTAAPAAPVGELPYRQVRTARAYTLAATNWGSATYADAHDRQANLATGRLRASLVHDALLPAEITQLAEDRESRIAAVTRIRPATSDARAVLVDVDELVVRAGRQIRESVRYRVELRIADGRWRVTAFGAVAGGPVP